MFSSGDRFTLKKKKIVDGVVASFHTVYHYPPEVWLRAAEKIQMLGEAISRGDLEGHWPLSVENEFECCYGYKRFRYFLVHEVYDKSGTRYIGIKKGRPPKDKKAKYYYFNNTGAFLDEEEWWAVQRYMPIIREQLSAKKKQKVPETEKKGVQCCWNYKDECFLCSRSRVCKTLKATDKGAVECPLCRRFFPKSTN